MMADLRRQILVLILFTELVLLAGSTGQASCAGKDPDSRIHRRPGVHKGRARFVPIAQRDHQAVGAVIASVLFRGRRPVGWPGARFGHQVCRRGSSDTWSKQARAKGLKLDPERSVITLVAIDDRKVAVHPGVVPPRACRPSKTHRGRHGRTVVHSPGPRGKVSRGRCVIAGHDRRPCREARHHRHRAGQEFPGRPHRDQKTNRQVAVPSARRRRRRPASRTR